MTPTSISLSATDQPAISCYRRPRTWLICASALTLIFSLSGCQSAMSTPNPKTVGRTTIVPNEFPLRFKGHNFEANCYNTIGCSIVYYNKYQVKDDPDELASPPKNAQYKDHWGGAVEIAIPNFPPPAIVKWRSLDGVAHEAEVDIGKIFKDQKILHHVPENEIPEGWAHDVRPDILMEVNDRVINVYMRAHIATKQEQIPGNKYSHFRNDLILAWSQTY
jgi:hypothetical protein